MLQPFVLPQRQQTIIGVLISVLVQGWSLCAHAHDQEWALPTFDVEPLEHTEVSIVTPYHFTQAKPQGSAKLPILDRKDTSMDTPEGALIARFSAVRTGNYQWWVETWTPDAWAMAEKKFSERGYDQNYWKETWDTSYKGKALEVTNKVTFEDYVILTYIFSHQKNDPTALEYPIVFKKVKGEYRVSLDFRAHPLLIASPWVSGESKEEIVIE